MLIKAPIPIIRQARIDHMVMKLRLEPKLQAFFSDNPDAVLEFPVQEISRSWQVSKIVIRVSRESHSSELIETRDFSLYGYIFDTQDEPVRTLLDWALNPADIDSAILQAERMYDDYIVRVVGSGGIQEGDKSGLPDALLFPHDSPSEVGKAVYIPSLDGWYQIMRVSSREISVQEIRRKDEDGYWYSFLTSQGGEWANEGEQHDLFDEERISPAIDSDCIYAIDYQYPVLLAEYAIRAGKSTHFQGTTPGVLQFHVAQGWSRIAGNFTIDLSDPVFIAQDIDLEMSLNMYVKEYKVYGALVSVESIYPGVIAEDGRYGIVLPPLLPIIMSIGITGGIVPGTLSILPSIALGGLSGVRTNWRVKNG